MSEGVDYINETLWWVINAIKQDENISEEFRKVFGEENDDD